MATSSDPRLTDRQDRGLGCVPPNPCTRVLTLGTSKTTAFGNKAKFSRGHQQTPIQLDRVLLRHEDRNAQGGGRVRTRRRRPPTRHQTPQGPAALRRPGLRLPASGAGRGATADARAARRVVLCGSDPWPAGAHGRPRSQEAETDTGHASASSCHAAHTGTLSVKAPPGPILQTSATPLIPGGGPPRCAPHTRPPNPQRPWSRAAPAERALRQKSTGGRDTPWWALRSTGKRRHRSSARAQTGPRTGPLERKGTEAWRLEAGLMGGGPRGHGGV